MRVGIVINTSWNIFNFRMSLIKALQKAGHTVIAIAPEDEYSKRLTDAGSEFVPVQMENKGT
ncbi:MAG: glycosyltransferase family 1 protein, partial [Hymenobacteraceae bacterium]|nr:glycosyltransferase family 1 protein [Hymenobacteraceae bacterium]MDX5395016.1 glycosyltransferase family 1 protein [Hymenobacteraceae bacterium]MDX5511048.1 glycosyltransferase family 1 protein [Hymenobacteraceae bacterium]